MTSRSLECKAKILLSLLIFCSLNLTAHLTKSEHRELYFNAATEKYLQGDYHQALENLEKAMLIDPESIQLRNFYAKIVIEASTRFNLSRQYRKAMEILEKVKKLSRKMQK